MVRMCFRAIFEKLVLGPSKVTKIAPKWPLGQKFGLRGICAYVCRYFLGCNMIITQALDPKELPNRFMNLLGMFRHYL